MRRAVLRISVVAATVAATALTTAGAAYAAADAVAYVNGGTLYFYDKDGAYNLNLAVRPAGTRLIMDANYKVVPMAGCTYPSLPDNTVVKCSGATVVYVYAGPGNDTVDVDPLGSAPGIGDVIFGEAGNDTLMGGSGDSSLVGGDGHDVLNGRGADDTVIGGAGPDDVYGGPGTDLVDYMSHTSGVHASLDDVIGDDGAAGEGDTLGSDLEDIFGTCHADVLIGNASANEIWPLGGSDEVRALGGSDYIEERDELSCGASVGYSADILDGGTGSDTVDYHRRPEGVTIDLDNAPGDDGAPGEGDTILNFESVRATLHNDTLTGNDSDNVFYGLAGNDTVYGLGGKDAVYADAGNDFVDGGAGTDYIYGGTDNDELYAGPGGYYIDGGTGTDFCGVADYVYNCE